MPLSVTSLPQYDRTQGQTGIVAPSSNLWFPSAVIGTGSRGSFVRFVPSRAMTIIAIKVTTTIAATANDACDVGIYSADLQTRIVSAGATTGKMNATAGVQSITVASTPLVANTVYYAAFSYGTVGGTAATIVQATYGNVLAGQLTGATAGTADNGFTAASHPLPTTLSVTAAGIANCPLLYLSEV